MKDQWSGAIMVFAVIHVSVLLSVTSRSCTKTAKCRITQTMLHYCPGTLVLWCKRSLQNSDGIIPTGVPNAGRVGKNCIYRPVEKSLTQKPYCWTFVSICHSGPHLWECAGGGICDVISNFGGSQNWWSQYGPVDVNKVGCTEVCWWHAWHRMLAVR